MIFPTKYYLSLNGLRMKAVSGFLNVNGEEVGAQAFHLIWRLVRYGSVRFLKLFV
jgi:hypothetical protein